MQNILESTTKTSSVRVVCWRFFLATSILLLSHTRGLAQDSGVISTGKSASRQEISTHEMSVYRDLAIERD